MADTVNKVVYDNEVLIDLTQDTVTNDTLLEGVTAHDATGASIVGTYAAAEGLELITVLHCQQPRRQTSCI